jgi:filamentous hemagglutinin family protein
MVGRSSFPGNRFGGFGLASGMLLAFPTAGLAQIAGDGSLGTVVNGSITDACTGDCTITAGAARGANLFHSFQQFSLPNGDVANFQISPSTQNVFVRVTAVGQLSVSNINGEIRTSNPANFFLLNPNGIIFGPRATLNVGGSFLATTASQIGFQDNISFGTTSSEPLLSINLPIGLQLNNSDASIKIKSSLLQAGQTDSFNDFILVGGNIAVDDTTILTPGGHVELDALAVGFVGLDVRGRNFSLNVPTGNVRADVAISNESLINVAAGDGGSIAVNARNLAISKQSKLFAGINDDLGSASSRAGNILLDATGVTEITSSQIFNAVSSDAIGSSGNISINAGSFFVMDSILATSTLRQGKAGDLIVKVNNDASLTENTVVATQMAGKGAGGNVEISAGNLFITGNSTLSAGIFGEGDAGDIRVDVRDKLILDMNGTVIDYADSTSVGRGGDVTVLAGSLMLKNGAVISTNFSGKGRGGNIKIDVRNAVSLDGSSSRGGSGFYSNSQPGAIGDVGSITVLADSLLLRGGAQITAATFAQGRAGNVNITTRDNVVLEGVGRSGRSSSIFSSVQLEGIGDGRDITITTPSLIVKEGATISGSTRGQGNGGNIVVNSKTFEALSGGQLITNTLKASNAGDIILNVSDSVFISGSDPTYADRVRRFGGRVGNVGATSGLFSSTTLGSSGNGGSIFLTPKIFTIQDGAKVAVDSQGLGQGGNIKIQSERIVLDRQGLISAETASNQGGNIDLNAQDFLLLRHRSQISTTVQPRPVVMGAKLISMPS